MPALPFPKPDHLGIKICGITSAKQAHQVITLGADALGLNFWPKSKRYLPPNQARTWAPELLDQTTVVAVLVNAEPELVDLILAERLAHILQLHGDESPADVARLIERGVPVIKALQVRDEKSLLQIGDYPCRTILLDAYNPGHYGGGGTVFPWELFHKAHAAFPDKQLILSGGLTAENVAQAVRETRPAAVDVASGVESSPGIKDLTLVNDFVTNARQAESQP